MANLTLTLEDAVLRRARLRALEQGTSVNEYATNSRASPAGVLRGAASSGSSTSLRRPTLEAAPTAARGRAKMRMTAPAFADTNLLVYAVDGDEPAKRRQAAAVLADESDSIIISTQVLAEFYVVVTRKLRGPLSETVAEQAVDALRQLPVVATDHELVAAGIARSRGSRLSLWDALIVEAALTAGCDRLLTEDLSDGASFGSLRVENPFRAL